ncbi:MAG: amidase [Acidobacteria bacterium]|nr:MAG: amidase [Acidobacteriota bacterium]PYR47057.1 MAG: amidase [Acidobacteriota bacterium]
MADSTPAITRRRFVTYFSSVGLSSTLLPGVLWARLQEERAERITAAMLKDALAVAGLDFTDEERQQILNGVNQNLTRYADLRQLHIDPNIAPPLYYSPIVPGTRLDRAQKPFRTSATPSLRRPANLEDVAFWPLAHLAHLLKTRQVTSVELSRMYLDRLKRYNPILNFVVTFTDDLGMQQAQQADREIAAGKYRGPLHGIPWGCKDIIAVPGYPTQWGSGAFKGQVIDTEATVVRLLREAGAVLVAKLTTGELASGDQWFGGRTNSPWDPTEGSSGSSAGPASATAAGCVAFGIGTETSGSILSPSTICGVTGLRPTFGRVSRYGAMTLSWTQDRLGPLCRTVEDCALVFRTIAKADEQDLSVIDLPFNWDAELDIRKLRIGYLAPAFREANRHDDWKRNDGQVLDQVKALGVTLEPFELPAMPLNVTGGILGAESGASFDEFVRSGRDKNLTNKGRSNGMRQSRLVPAVEYLQAQRVRAMIMRQFAATVSRFDVYIAPYINMRSGGAGRSGRAGGAAGGDSTPPLPPSAIRDHFQVANLCGYPAVSVPNGFTAEGKPTSITFLGRLYAEAEILALARAYQERAGFHLRRPTL